MNRTTKLYLLTAICGFVCAGIFYYLEEPFLAVLGLASGISFSRFTVQEYRQAKKLQSQ